MLAIYDTKNVWVSQIKKKKMKKKFGILNSF